MLTEGIALCHHISSIGIKVDPTRIEVISKLPPPQTQKDVRSFLGHASYYRRFIENFTKIATPMFKLLTKDAHFVWDSQCQTTFQILKEKLSTTPMIQGPNWSLPFHISTNASDTTLGVVLVQKENQITNSIYFISRNLTPPECNYTVTEKEFLVVVYSINKFRHYITSFETFIHTDHSSIKFLINKPITNGRITRWLLLLQEFNVTIIDRLGKENLVAEFLSRINHGGEMSPMNNDFPYEHLFALATNPPWYAYLTNYLTTKKLPRHLSSRKKKKNY